jgi:hypothetical protein
MKPENKLMDKESIDTGELNTKRSTALSVWFILIPIYLIFCAIMKMSFNLQLHLFDIFDEFFKSFNHGIFGQIIAPSLMLGLPAVAIIINMLAVLEMYYDRTTRELRIRLKNKPLNFLILLLAILVLGLFVVYWFTKV